MKIGYNEATAKGCSNLEKDLILCEKYGYDYIEIRVEMLRDYLKTHTVEDLKTFFDNSKLKPKVFNSCREINFRNDKDWQEIIDYLMLACETGKVIGCNCIIAVPSPLSITNGYSEEEIFKDSVDRLEKLLDISKDYDMNFAFEPVGNRCVATIHQAWNIVKYIDNPRLGLTLDAFNLYLYNKLNDFKEMKIVDVDKIFVVHVNDSDDLPLEKLDHCNRCFPFEGVINLNNFIKTLKEMDYHGIVSIETFRPEYWEKDPEWVIKNGYLSVKKLINCC